MSRTDYELLTDRSTDLISQRINTPYDILVLLLDPNVSFRYLDESSVDRPLHPLIFLSNNSPEDDLIPGSRVSNGHNLIVQFFSRIHEFSVEYQVRKGKQGFLQ